MSEREQRALSALSSRRSVGKTDVERNGHGPPVNVTVPRPDERGGDREVFDLAAIYREHHAFVWRILRRLGVPNLLLEDATQEVFAIVHRRRDRYDPVHPMRSWLFGIARRVAAVVRRGELRLIRKLRAVPQAPPRPTLDDELARAQASELVERFLHGLDEDRRLVFVLVDIEGLSAPEVSAALGVKLNTVYSRLRAARLAFRQALIVRTAKEEGG